MKKRLLILVPFVLAAMIVLCEDLLARAVIHRNAHKAIYYNVDHRNYCAPLLHDIITAETIVVLGSSELHASLSPAYPATLYNHGYADYNMVPIGRAKMQSLQHAIDVGALDKNIPDAKIVLIVSPQWFTKDHLDPDTFAVCFEEMRYEAFLQNPDIPKDLKERVSSRIRSLLVTDPEAFAVVEEYETLYLGEGSHPALRVQALLHDTVRDIRDRYRLARLMLALTDDTDYSHKVIASDIDFAALLEESEALGAEAASHNDFGMDDAYFDTHFAADLASYRGISSGESYTDSAEYDDFRLFLEVCRACEISPLIISIPVNGYWYDYTGFPISDRQQYYQNIRDICAEYGVACADFTDKEYEKYFFSDAMHLGWKGWVYVDEAMYRYHCGVE